MSARTHAYAAARGGTASFSWRDFARRRGAELTGALLVAAGVAALLALASYRAADPSANLAADGHVANWLGLPGAAFADMLLQALGLTALLPVAFVLASGMRMVLHLPLRRMAWRGAALVAATFAAAAALAALPVPEAWPLRSALGGVGGDIVGGGLMRVVGIAGPAVAGWIVPVAATAAAVLLAFLAFAIGPRSLVAASRGVARGGSAAWNVGSIAAVATARGARWAADRLPSAPSLRREPHFGARLPLAEADAAFAASLAARGEAEPGEEADDEKRAPRQRRIARPATRGRPAAQRALDLLPTDGAFALPALELLAAPADNGHVARNVGDDALKQNAQMLESVLEDFGVRGEIGNMRLGPVVTLYELVPEAGTKTSRVIGLADDIARSMSAVSVRIAVVPGRNVIGIELPNAHREVVYLSEVLASPAFTKHRGALPLVLGKDIGGEPVIVDLARMPHLLIAGTTGSGKSVGINAMIASLLYRLKPEECRFIMIDPKMLELSVYDGIPHLLAPVVTDPRKAVGALKWVVREMENRYRSMSKLGVRNIAGYNQRLEQARQRGEVLSRKVHTGFDAETGKPVFEEEALDLTALPLIVVVVDEMADLMLVAGKEVEVAIQRLAQMARAAGIHIIMATQRPSVDVITGTIKANFPTRISFQVTSKIDSRTILGEQGAEQLLGQGDMLYMAGGGRIMRIHGPFVADTEVEAVAQWLRRQGEPDYVDAVTEDEDAAAGIPGFDAADGEGGGEDLYYQAVALVAREGKASTSFIQRHLQIGYNRAARLVERMEKEGVITQPNHAGKREVLVGDHSR
ncbi:MAG: cell division protein FtsK [Alphaproteobacteria bacterium]|nr:cell division protein FtsK [Alphaproteobacteria bacterium]